MIRLSLRFLIPLLLTLALIGYALLPLVDNLTLSWFRRDLDARSRLIADALHDTLIPLIESASKPKVEALFNRVTRDERLFAVGFCDPHEQFAFRTPTLPADIRCKESIEKNQNSGYLLELPDAAFHVFSVRFESEGKLVGHLVLLHDMSFVKRRSAVTKRYIFYLFLVLGTVISLLTVLIAQFSWRGWISGLRAILRGEGLFKPTPLFSSPELRPILKDLKVLVRDLETEYRVRDEHQVSWDPRALKNILHENLAGEEVIIVSNREPYIHVKRTTGVEVQFPASGLVTALEPIMRACSGTWIAHGSGSADKEMVDRHDHIHVPPESPSYRLRRVWLTEEEEKGYYYGFSNEGLWPLCNIAHVRPIFRTDDWDQYVHVNKKFLEVVLKESKSEDPVILVQDYHFALLPKLIREKLPRATIITFWHIPWPNPEAFGICPWREEILMGLLGSTVLGFHTRFHCNNFLDTVDRFLESRIDREHSTISQSGKLTAIRHYPISIEWPPRWLKDLASVDLCRDTVRKRHGMSSTALIGMGVDRMDYTKGILERFLAVDRLLELYPEWKGKFHFLQISAPSRTRIERYRLFNDEVKALCWKINEKHGTSDYQPIKLINEHYEPHQVFEHFRAADLCFVSSLHDGMNLVAKEFVAARDDERGVLLLSMFTGASRELSEALIVNPYNIDQCAEALNAGLKMEPAEQRERMRSMRSIVKEYNIYRWAGKMLMDASKIRHRNRLMDRMRDWKFLERGGF